MSHLTEEDYPMMEPAPKPFLLFTEIIGWLQIFASPFLAGVLIGAVVYLSMSNKTGLSIGGTIAGVGLFVGVIWAARVWRKGNTSRYMSRAMSSPEFDDIKKD
jgi:hypothetical protein